MERQKYNNVPLLPSGLHERLEYVYVPRRQFPYLCFTLVHLSFTILSRNHFAGRRISLYIQFHSSLKITNISPFQLPRLYLIRPHCCYSADKTENGFGKRKFTEWLVFYFPQPAPCKVSWKSGITSIHSDKQRLQRRGFKFRMKNADGKSHK